MKSEKETIAQKVLRELDEGTFPELKEGRRKSTLVGLSTEELRKAYGNALESRHILEGTIFKIHKNSPFMEYLTYKPTFKPIFSGSEAVDSCKYTFRSGNYGFNFVPTERARSVKEKARIIPYIIKKAFKHGWQLEELPQYWKYVDLEPACRRGFNIVSIGA
jgi:hypothetical protein